jgi:Ca2+-binding RTX toxin-like protein
VLRGGQGNDVLAVSDTNFHEIVGGRGTDTLRLDGSGLTLDLTAISDTRIQGIEVIDLNGSGAQTLRLSPQEVLRISGESNTLVVKGGADDAAVLSAGWKKVGTTVLDGVNYDVYKHGYARLKVAQAIDIVPLGNSDLATGFANTPLSVAAPGVLANDIDLEGDPLMTGPQHGELDLHADGAFVYTPDADFVGTDTFTYAANDGAQNSEVVMVHLTIASVTFQSGQLNVVGVADNAITVSAAAGAVLVRVNGVAAPNLAGVAASSVTAITVTGGTGANQIDLSGVTAADFTALPSVSVDGGDANDTIVGTDLADTLQGSTGDDSLQSNGGGDLVIGSAGDDTLVGGDGDDSLLGGSGRDRIDSGAGNDWLSGQGSADTLLGGAGG